VSASTIDGVRTILEQRTAEQIQSLRDRSETREGVFAEGVYTVVIGFQVSKKEREELMQITREIAGQDFCLR